MFENVYFANTVSSANLIFLVTQNNIRDLTLNMLPTSMRCITSQMELQIKIYMSWLIYYAIFIDPLKSRIHNSHHNNSSHKRIHSFWKTLFPQISLVMSKQVISILQAVQIIVESLYWDAMHEAYISFNSELDNSMHLFSSRAAGKITKKLPSYWNVKYYCMYLIMNVLNIELL